MVCNEILAAHLLSIIHSVIISNNIKEYDAYLVTSHTIFSCWMYSNVDDIAILT